MPTTKKSSSAAARFIAVDKELGRLAPNFMGVVRDEGSFIDFRIKLRDDSTMLIVLKKYGPDGGPLVCFASGYGLAGALLSLEGTLAANAWRVDKPWTPPAR